MRGGSAWPLSVQIEAAPGGALLRLLGEVDTLTAPMFQEQLRDTLQAHKRVVVDGSDLDYIDVIGIKVLIDIRQDNQGRVAVVGSKPIMRKIFEILQIRSVIPFMPDRNAALKFLQA